MRVLIANPFGIGDVLFSLPLINALRQADPECWIGYVCNRRTLELVEHHPDLNWIIPFEKDEFRTLWRESKRAGIKKIESFIGRIKGQKFDCLIDLSLSRQISAAAWWIGIPKRVGFDFRNRGQFLTDHLPLSGFSDKPVAEYYLSLLPLLGIDRPVTAQVRLPLPKQNQQSADQQWANLKLSKTKLIIAWVPGGGASWGPNAPMKTWPINHFISAANQLHAHTGAQILCIGDQADQPLCDRLTQGATAPSELLKTDSLLTLGGILKKCDLVIGNDSGAMHLAAAAGAKTMTLFGPVDGSVYGPFPSSDRNQVLSKALACRPCYQQFRLPPCPWDHRCLKELHPNQVVDLAQVLLKTDGSPAPEAVQKKEN